MSDPCGSSNRIHCELPAAGRPIVQQTPIEYKEFGGQTMHVVLVGGEGWSSEGQGVTSSRQFVVSADYRRQTSGMTAA